MSSRSKWLGFAVVVAGVAGLLAWHVMLSARQSARAQATTQPIRISKDKDGQTIIAITAEEQARSGIGVQPLAAISFQPQVIAYGTLQDDPANSLTLRAPFAG